MTPLEHESWNAYLANLSPREILHWAVTQFGDGLTMATALGLEAQILTHLIAEMRLPVPIFTLDTGRLFDETHALIAETEARYGVRIKTYHPHHEEVERLVNDGGTNLFRESPDQRKRCCEVRKVNPLHRALAGKKAWITGLRGDQSETRSEMNLVQWDAKHGLVKINPLFNWNENEVWDFIHSHQVPYNALLNRGFSSIGCAPCTRAIRPGEDSRAGRWWWEESSQKECGIHIVNGRVTRVRQPISV